MSKRNAIWLAVVAVVAFGFYRLALLASQQDTVYRTFAPLVEVDALVHQKFVDPIEDQRLVDGAIRGMMLKLDPYSGYIPPDQLSSFRHWAAGEYVGIGVHLGTDHGLLTVIAPIEQSPAIVAGIQPGDVILAIDGTSTEGLGVADANRLIGGQPGTSVTLTVRHVAQTAPEEIRITRAPIKLNSVKGYRRLTADEWDYTIDPENRIAYLRISNFHDNTASEVDEALQQIRRRGPRALVLDLRFNPGGSLASAVAIADRFLTTGLIVSTVTRHQAVDEYRARPEGTFAPIPMAVLINGRSASASEIVAGCLQDQKRAVVVGGRSFGKGVVQSVMELAQYRAAISLTVAHYRLPGGRIIHKTPQNAHTDEWGVLPDVVVPLTHEQELEIQTARHAADVVPAEPSTAPADDVEPPLVSPAIPIDDQLAAALTAVLRQLPADEAEPTSD
ncbi:MAG: S41 family peptidase [bacterium]|nr:S41 family peptidase [bacterium]